MKKPYDSAGSISVLMRIVVLLYFQIPSVPTFHNRAAIPSGTGSLRACLRQHPFAAATLDRAALFHRLKRIGKGPAAHLHLRRPQLFGEFGERKRAGPFQDLSDGGANGLSCLRRVVCRWPPFRLCL